MVPPSVGGRCRIWCRRPPPGVCGGGAGFSRGRLAALLDIAAAVELSGLLARRVAGAVRGAPLLAARRAQSAPGFNGFLSALWTKSPRGTLGGLDAVAAAFGYPVFAWISARFSFSTQPGVAGASREAALLGTALARGEAVGGRTDSTPRAQASRPAVGGSLPEPLAITRLTGFDVATGHGLLQVGGGIRSGGRQAGAAGPAGRPRERAGQPR